MHRPVCGFVLLFAAFTLSAIAIGAQTKSQPKPDLTGEWLLDAKKSNSGGLNSRPDLPMKISHQDPEFRVTLSSELNGQVKQLDFTYFTDGRGETNVATTGLTTNPSGARAPELANQLTKSTTKWSGNKIVTRSSLRLNTGGVVVEFEQIDEWKLSADGKTLTQTNRLVFQRSNVAFAPAMVPDKKRVYNRL
jgi:hypothetical protein